MEEIKQLCVISGKGGTGKTSLMAAFSSLIGNKVLCDADVDAADLQVFFSAYGSMVSDANFIPEADLNGDGVVDAIDLYYFAEEFGRVDCPLCP